ncbi:HAMP domain-containing histidine kinase [Caenimonas sedimenti]|uniref:histidine kinase n=1 Tax=Caenimonas sedimenti TaxID=2596921 RepID=A0A562ZKL2_9BURK|nr:HAMP domain-containing sensor histidine kinase [Caenimonas sedimenti]TWO68714.1 HAMP domain-containing histidine kinase [Caenimonas sedimenti]
MLERLRRAWARVPLRARLLLLLVAGLLSAQAASLWWALSDRAASARQAALVLQVQRAADLVAVIDAVPPGQRAAVAAALPYPLLRLNPVPQPEAAPPEVLAVARGVWARRLPGRPVSVVATRGPLQRARPPGRTHGLRIVLGTSLGDGQLVQAEVEVGQSRFRTEGLLGPFVLLGVVTSLLVVLAMRLVLRPLEQLAVGAEALGTGLDATPLPEAGPPEVRRAAEVLNRLHARLKEHVQGRVQSLAAISHDLRTPITRLRLRAELLPDPESRTSFARDLRQLEEMVQGTLDYLRGIGEAAPLEPVDLDGLLAQAVEDVEALGAAVPHPEPTGLIVQAHAPALRRALVNLLRNAVVHAAAPELAVEAAGGVVRIHVMDRGPGIPESEIARVLRPFEQLDPSRGTSPGAGLGLSIASEVALRHGGRLVIRNRDGGGLCATLELAPA